MLYVHTRSCVYITFSFSTLSLQKWFQVKRPMQQLTNVSRFWKVQPNYYCLCASFRWRVLQNISIFLKDPLGIFHDEEEASHFTFFLWGVAQILHFGIRVINEHFITKSVSSATHREKWQIWASPQEKLTNLGHTPKKNVKFISQKIT